MPTHRRSGTRRPGWLLDQLALPQNDGSRRDLERQVEALWRDLLGRPQTGGYDETPFRRPMRGATAESRLLRFMIARS